MKGVTLVPKTAVVLSLDGTLVYVEDIQPTFAAVVAFPEQPAERSDDRVFTPGRVGAKKISPFAQAGKTVAIADLSERNKLFLDSYEKIRDERGPNVIQRTPEEEAAMSVTKANPQKPSREERKAARKAEREARKAAGETVPRYKRKCVTCGEQPGHPNHPDQHPFLEPADKPVREKKERAPRAGKPSTDGPFKWVGDEKALNVMASGNPKYKEKNSGRAIAYAVRDGATTPDEVVAALMNDPKWNEVSIDRIKAALIQLIGAGLVENA